MTRKEDSDENGKLQRNKDKGIIMCIGEDQDNEYGDDDLYKRWCRNWTY